MCCYVYAIAIVFMFVDAFLAGAANIVTLRDFVSLIFYAVAGYFLHKDKFIWAPVVLVFYVLDKLLFSFDFGIISHWTLQIPFFAGFLSGSIAFLRYHFYQQKKTAEYAQARFSSGED